MLKDDAKKDHDIRINPFRITTYKQYGYIKKIIAQCKYCNAQLKYKGIRTEIDHFKDGQRFNNDSSHSNPSYERIVKIVYRLSDFENQHQHNKENANE